MHSLNRFYIFHQVIFVANNGKLWLFSCIKSDNAQVEKPAVRVTQAILMNVPIALPIACRSGALPASVNAPPLYGHRR